MQDLAIRGVGVDPAEENLIRLGFVARAAHHLGQSQGGGAGRVQVAGRSRAFRDAGQHLAQGQHHFVGAKSERFLHVHHRGRVIPASRSQFGTQAEEIGASFLGTGRKRVRDDRSRGGQVPSGGERGGQLAQGLDVSRCSCHGQAQTSGSARLVAQLVALEASRLVQKRTGFPRVLHPRGLAREQLHQLGPKFTIAVVRDQALEEVRVVRAATSTQFQSPSRTGVVVQADAQFGEIHRVRRSFAFTLAGQDLLAQGRTLR